VVEAFPKRFGLGTVYNFSNIPLLLHDINHLITEKLYVQYSYHYLFPCIRVLRVLPYIRVLHYKLLIIFFMLFFYGLFS